MRIAVSLDDDVAALLERTRKANKGGLKEVVNEALRYGLQQMAAPPERRKPYRTRTVSLGRCLLGDLDDISAAIAIAEGQGFRRISLSPTARQTS